VQFLGLFFTFFLNKRYFCASLTKLYKTMGVTELKRKSRRNKETAKNRVARIKDLLRRPEIRNVDVEAIKAEFEANKK
jgi:hypothetical protein